MANSDYLQLMEDMEAGDDARFQASATQALSVNADRAAAAKRVAGYLGVPPAVVEGAPEDAERRAKLQKLNEDSADAPALRRMYGNADWAKLAHDDSGPLSAIEKAVRTFMQGGGQRRPMAPPAAVMRGSEYSERVREFMRENPLVDADTARRLMAEGVVIDNQSPLIGPPQQLKPSVASVAAGLYTALVQGARATDAGLGRMAADYLGMPEQAARHARQGQQAANRILLARPEFDSALADWAYGGLESTAQIAPGLAVSILMRQPQLATAGTMAQFGVSTTAQAYGKYRDRGASIGEATLASVLEGGVEVGTELLPMKYLTEKFGKVGLGDLVSHFLARDAAGEQIATLLQDAIDTAVANPEKTFGDYLAERPEAAARTLVATLTQFGVLAGANSAARRTFMAVEAQLEQARTAEDQAKQLTEILQLASGSKLRERDAGSFAEFVHEATKDADGDGRMYVDAATLGQVLAQSGVTLDQLRELSPTAAAQLPDATELNGTVAIPVQDLIGRIAGGELEQQLLPHLRLTEDGLSQEEAKLVTAQAQQFLEQAAQRVVEQAADAAVMQLSQSKVMTTMLDQLNTANRFTKDVNEAYAQLVASFYTAVAQRFNITPEEMYQRFPLRVQAARPEGATIHQDAARQVQVNGTWRPIADSTGRVVGRTFQEQQNFWKWFGESKVATRDGKPLAMYHGTNKTQDGEAFTMFDTYASNYGLMGQGSYFTAEPMVASEYTNKGRGEAPTVYPVYLSIKNPLDMEAKADADAWRKAFPDAESFHEGGDTNESWYRAAEEAMRDAQVPSYEGAEAMQEGIRSMGHDGITHIGGGRVKDGSVRHRVFIAFDPEQIKSAIGNDGTYDATDASILSQGAPNGTDPGDGSGRPAGRGAAPLAGAPNVAGATGPDPRIVAVAQRYAAEHGIPFGRQAEYAQVDEERAARIAAAYDAMPHAPQDPAVKAAYADLIEQTIAQYRALEAAGYKFWLFDERNDPYAGNPWNAMRDLRANQQMGVFATEAGFGSGATELNVDDNPLLADTGIVWPYGGLDGQPKRVLANDLFRAVHDALGHGLEGAGFRAQGEENAWQAHVRLFTGPAVGAATSETRGQNSWLNFGPYGEQNRTAKVEDTVFADQKTGLMPDWAWTEGRVPDEGELQQGPRGSFSPSSLTITLLERADLSTFLHETGHFFLEAMADMAAQRDAPADIQKDMLTVLEWFGVRTLAEWNAMSLDEQRPHHEKFAESFEQYLFEGKAPSREMASLFGRFRAWLTNVYRSLQTFLSNYNTDLSDEVRQVFDRLLATQEQIEQAEQDSGFASMLAHFEGKVDPALLDHYKRLTAEATEDAMARLHARSLRDLKWVVNARSRELKRLTKDVGEKREAVLKEVTAEVDAAPEMRAAARLEEIMRTTPEVKDARKDWRDRRAAALERARGQVKAKYTADADAQGLKGLQKGQFLAKNRKAIDHEVNGLMIDWEKANPFPVRPPLDEVPLDTIAEGFGFTSGDHMLQAIDAFGPRDAAIEGITNQRMLERYGDLITPEGLQRAANEAVHSEARARAVAAELQALQDSVTAKAPTGKTITAQTKQGRVQYQQTTNVIVEAARRFADNLVARQKVRELRASQHQAAERRAARLAMEAAAKGKSEEAMAAKRDQLLNFYAAKGTLEAIDEIERGVKYLRKVADSETLDPDYAEQIAVMLERFDLRPASNKALDRRATLLEWVEAQREMGVEPNIPPELLDEARRRNFRDMTVEEFRGLVDAVKQIEHLGRLKHKLLTAKDEREFAAVVQEMVDGMLAHAGADVDTRTPNTWLGEKLLAVRKFGAEHVKVATWARVMDGGKDGGPVWEYLIRNANEAGMREITMRERATREVTALIEPILKLGKMGGKGSYVAEVGRSFNREARLAIALNTGNASNLQRLMGGESWTQDQVDAILATLSEQEWRFVQKVWDYFESFRPEIAAKEKRVSGVEPKWLEAAPREVQTADGKMVKLRGGYYPVKYDPRASERAESHADAEAAKQQMRGAYTSATTRRSFTKDRAEEVHGRPLLYSLDGLYNGLNEVIHDLAWHEFLIDANRLVRNQAISGAMRQKYGPEAHQQFKSWLQDVAAGDAGMRRAGEAAASWVRQGVAISRLGYSITTALVQPLGITQSWVRIGGVHVARGVRQYLASPLDSVDTVHAKSDFMRTRTMTRFRELAEVRTRIKGQGKARQAFDGGAFYLMLKMQRAVDTPTWLGAYDKAITEGNADARAVALADQAVIDSQGSGTLKDLSAIERGGPVSKLFTVFYSFFNSTLNLGVLSAKTRKSPAQLAADFLLLAIIPATLGSLLREALTPGGDEDDWVKLARQLAGENIGYLMGTLVGVRELTPAVRAATNTTEFPAQYGGPAGLAPLNDATRVGIQVGQGEADDGLRKAVISLAGSLMRLPSSQINRSITGWQALADGKTKNPVALLMGYDDKD